MGAATATRSPAALVAALLALLLALVMSPLLIVVLATSIDGGGQGGPVDDIPPAALVLYRAAGAEYRLDWAILAAIAKIETDHCRSDAPGVHSGANFAGAQGCMQFLRSTWDLPGIGEGGDPYDLHDAIYAAARYLRRSGAPEDYRRAIYAYKHADWYVAQVLDQAAAYRAAADAPGAGATVPIGDGKWLAPVPGFRGETCDRRILPDVTYLIRRYRVAVTDCYAPTGHAADGEHPLGLAVDLVPGQGGSWDDVDRLAAWAEPSQNQPRAPFRWVGYNGDAGHGRGDHLHLSWSHGPGRPAETVDVFRVP